MISAERTKITNWYISKTMYDISFGSKEFSGQQVCQNAVR